MIKKRIFFICIVLTFTGLHGWAQPGGGGDPGGGEPVPLQGLFFLLLAGAALGIRSLVRKKQH